MCAFGPPSPDRPQMEVVSDATAAQSAPFSEVATGLSGAGKISVGVQRAGGLKCARCWNYSAGVGSAPAEHPGCCERCWPVVERLGFRLPMTAVVAAPVAA